MTTDHPQALERTLDARTQALGALARLEPLVLAPLLNAALTGGPTWPSMRQGWLVGTRQGRAIMFSHGLSDPDDPELFEEGSPLGLGLEFVIEADAPPQDGQGWLQDAIIAVSNTAAGHGGILGLIEGLEVISVEVEGRFPGHLLSPEGRVGVLLGGPCDLPSHLRLPAGDVRLVPITLLLPAELAHIHAHGHDGRLAIAEGLRRHGHLHRCRPERAPVV